MEMQHQKSIYIHSYETNRYGDASVTALFNFFIEIAWEHAQTLNWGFEKLKNENLFWVLSRIYIEIDEYPRWQDKLVLHTWPTGTDGMYAYREFDLRNEKGKTIVRASSAWLILDIESKRIFRLAKMIDTFPNLEELVVCKRPERIRPFKDKPELNFIPVMYSELDINQHFNSVKFVERALNHYGIDFLNNNEVTKIEINYLKEGLPENSLAVAIKNTDDRNDLISIVRESDNVDLCVLKIEWRKR